MTKKISLSLLAILLVSCFLISAGLIAAAVFLFKSQKSYIPPTPDPANQLSIDEQMDLIQSQVSVFRGLALKTSLDRSLLTTNELEKKVVDEFFADYTPQEAKDDAHLLAILGLLQPEFDLVQFYKDLYSEQIAGYYDSQTREMYVITDEGFDGLTRMTYAHEFTHALQDQIYDLENGLGLNDDHCNIDSEYCAAVTALIEGDASLSEQFWFLSHSTDQDKKDVSYFQSTYQSPIYDSAPPYMQKDFLFPYQQGLQFVNTLYKQGKWNAVDAAYQNPPLSTEQILHPEKYPDDKPVRVKLPDISTILPQNWRKADENSMGEWYTSLVLSSGIDPRTNINQNLAEQAAAGWGGDTYGYFVNDEGGYLLAWLSRWDTENDATEFFTQSHAYGKLRWGDEDYSTAGDCRWTNTVDGSIEMRIQNEWVLWIVSNTPEVTLSASKLFMDFN